MCASARTCSQAQNDTRGISSGIFVYQNLPVGCCATYICECTVFNVAENPVKDSFASYLHLTIHSVLICARRCKTLLMSYGQQSVFFDCHQFSVITSWYFDHCFAIMIFDHQCVYRGRGTAQANQAWTGYPDI